MIVAELVTTDTCDRCGRTEPTRSLLADRGGSSLPGDWQPSGRDAVNDDLLWRSVIRRRLMTSAPDPKRDADGRGREVVTDSAARPRPNPSP